MTVSTKTTAGERQSTPLVRDPCSSGQSAAGPRRPLPVLPMFSDRHRKGQSIVCGTSARRSGPLRGMMSGRNERTRERPALQTGRLLLRRPDARDVGPIVAIVGDWEVVRRLARVPHPYREADAHFFLDTIVPNEWTWAITLRDSGELVGMVGLTPEVVPDTAELGYYVSRDHWGKGIATEAAGSVVHYGIQSLGLRRITSGHFVDNPASGRVLRKLGFVEIGRSERSCLAIGSTLPSIEVLLEVSG
jgi:RimJ/RimL family protein N-acetyltransferase